MVNGSSALKINTQVTNDINRNYIGKAQSIHKVNSNSKHKWRVKEEYRMFYLGAIEFIGMLSIIVAIPFLAMVFFG
jgi:hypothetical protein